jgi:putative Mg2+ transporter-C (MgtC) family protein
MPVWNEMLLQLLYVIIVGGLIGAEREYRSKSAGFRTMILICLGSYLFTIFSIALGHADTDRIAANIVTGIGFLGAGVIFRSGDRINGITTAASIWIVAALGMGIADGFYKLVGVATLIVLASLLLLTKLENLIDLVNQSHNYRIVSFYRPELLYQYEELFREHGLSFKRIKQTKIGDRVTGTWLVQGRRKSHKKLIEQILHDNSVIEFEF